MTIHRTHIWKLSPKYAGPFQIVRKIGKVAYTLALPPSAKIHPTFHVSLLKKRVGTSDRVSNVLPEFDADGKVILTPTKILARRLVKRGNAAATELLLQWAHLPDDEATWEDSEFVQRRFPHLLA